VRRTTVAPTLGRRGGGAGLTTHWSDVRPTLAPAGVLATAGVGASVVLTAAGAHLLLGMD
jgi:cell volume regulation protein A